MTLFDWQLSFTDLVMSVLLVMSWATLDERGGMRGLCTTAAGASLAHSPPEPDTAPDRLLQLPCVNPTKPPIQRPPLTRSAHLCGGSERPRHPALLQNTAHPAAAQTSQHHREQRQDNRPRSHTNSSDRMAAYGGHDAAVGCQIFVVMRSRTWPPASCDVRVRYEQVSLSTGVAASVV
jgi:hypothetical protein